MTDSPFLIESDISIEDGGIITGTEYGNDFGYEPFELDIDGEKNGLTFEDNDDKKMKRSNKQQQQEENGKEHGKEERDNNDEDEDDRDDKDIDISKNGRRIWSRNNQQYLEKIDSSCRLANFSWRLWHQMNKQEQGSITSDSTYETRGVVDTGATAAADDKSRKRGSILSDPEAEYKYWNSHMERIVSDVKRSPQKEMRNSLSIASDMAQASLFASSTEREEDEDRNNNNKNNNDQVKIHLGSMDASAKNRDSIHDESVDDGNGNSSSSSNDNTNNNHKVHASKAIPIRPTPTKEKHRQVTIHNNNPFLGDVNSYKPLIGETAKQSKQSRAMVEGASPPLSIFSSSSSSSTSTLSSRIRTGSIAASNEIDNEIGEKDKVSKSKRRIRKIGMKRHLFPRSAVFDSPDLFHFHSNSFSSPSTTTSTAISAKMIDNRISLIDVSADMKEKLEDEENQSEQANESFGEQNDDSGVFAMDESNMDIKNNEITHNLCPFVLPALPQMSSQYNMIDIGEEWIVPYTFASLMETSILSNNVKLEEIYATPERMIKEGYLSAYEEECDNDDSFNKSMKILHHRSWFKIIGNILIEQSEKSITESENKGVGMVILRPDILIQSLHNESDINKSFSFEYIDSRTRKRRRIIFIADTKEEADDWIKHLKRGKDLAVDDVYDMRNPKSLGNGPFCTVVESFEKNCGNKCALKIIEKNKFWEAVKSGKERADMLVRESSIQAMLTSAANRDSKPEISGSNNIAKLYSIFETSNFFYLAIELFESGDLFQLLSDKGILSETEAKMAVKDVLKAVSFLQRFGVAHRDIKLTNLLLKQQSGSDCQYKIVLADFGLSVIQGSDGLIRGRCGTPGFVAPEILHAKPSEGIPNNVDVFSIGVVAFCLLSGYEPFHGETEQEILESNKNGKILFYGDEFDEADSGCFNEDVIDVDNDSRHDFSHVSKEGRELLSLLLRDTKSYRPKAENALESKWFL